VPNGTLPVLEMRPFQLAKCRKVRDFNVDFLIIFLAAYPQTPMLEKGYGASRALLGTLGLSIARKRERGRVVP